MHLAGETFGQTVSLEGAGHPFLLDTNSGEITPIAKYTYANGRTQVHVRLEKDDTTIIVPHRLALSLRPA